MQLKDFYTCIQHLLHDYDCVIIPGFGGLVAQPQPAQVNTITRQMYPRSKKIAFNQNLLNNDGLLAEYISRNQKCTYAEAVLQIHTFVKQLQHELTDKNMAEFEGIGTFRYDAENKLIFSASRNETFLYDSFGLKPVKAVPLTVVNDKPRIMEKEEEVVPVTADAEDIPVSETAEEKASRRKRKVSIPFVVVSVVVVAFAGLTMYLASMNATLPFLHTDGSQSASFVDTSSEEINASAQPEGEDESRQPASENNLAETGKDESSTAVVSERKTIQEQAATPTSPVSTEASADAGYYIIAGAFQIETNAEKLLNELKSAGYSGAQLAGRNESGNLLRVAYLKATDMQEAETKLAEIRNNSKEGWILHIR